MTYNTTITTNSQWRDLLYHWEVPSDIINHQFDYLQGDDLECATFFKYKGFWYSLDQFMTIGDKGSYWEGAHGESAFSAILIKLSDDGERVIVGRKTC